MMTETAHVYATQPGPDGPVDLRLRLFTPDAAPGSSADAAEAPPLLVWLHSGGFFSGSPDARPHIRIAHHMARQGYATAFLQYRLKTEAAQLLPTTQARLPDLIADAEAAGETMRPYFYGPAALAVVEDCAAFFDWLTPRRAELGLGARTLLGGSSAGAISVLNTLFLATSLGLVLPPIATAVVLSGGFAYPGFYQPNDTRILALHGTDERQIPVTSIRRFAHQAAAQCTLIEDDAHEHGDFRLDRDEALRTAIRRIARFDRGAAPTPERRKTGWPAPRPIKDRHRIVLVTCVKNEGPFLLEWLAHNRAIGVTDFLIFSNDCDDGTAELLDMLDAKGLVRHIPNPSMVLGSDQHLNLALMNARYHRDFHRCDYCLVVDVDEFVQIDVADGTLNGLIALNGQPDAISISELLYGFGGVERFEDRLVTDTFRISDDLRPGLRRARRGVKSLVRIDPKVLAYGNHRPTLRDDAVQGLDWVDGAGQAVPDDFIRDGRRGLDCRGRYAQARVAHYTLRSAESMLVKYARGDAVRNARMRPAYIRDRNGRQMRNAAFLPFVPRLRAALAEILADPEIAARHADCVARHRAKIAQLKADPAYAEIWRAILDELAQPVIQDSLALAQAAE